MSAQMDFADLYTRHAQSVFRFAYLLSGNRELAEDIAAETFARALTARNHIQPGSVKAYLLAVARNLFLDWTRAQGRMRPLLDEDLDAADPTPDPEEVTAARLDLEATQDALQHVPERERAALLMAANFIVMASIATVFWIAFFVSLIRIRARILIVTPGQPLPR
jgi:RNA polymerase sigma-70 factor (ECF subfamily)